MDADPSIVCDVAVDSTYRYLRLLSTLTLGVYGAGIPVGFLLVVAIHRKAIRADQVLRGQGLGYTEASNPNVNVRRRYQKVRRGLWCPLACTRRQWL